MARLKEKYNSVVVPKIEAVAKELVKSLNSEPVSEMYQTEIFATAQIKRVYAH